eukprot:SM000003S10976  [mRNA]  locus=s3:46343:49800:- [translate_table: standard]
MAEKGSSATATRAPSCADMRLARTPPLPAPMVNSRERAPPLPYLLFLQGGPGHEAPRPAEAAGWLADAVKSHRVVLLDQRGTGLSTALSVAALAQLGPPDAQAAYLAHFRADSIVRDAELLRAALLPGGDRWTVLGQSFGGFCTVTYLSMAPEGLKRALLAGGLPPIDRGCTAEQVYRACFRQVAAQTAKYYRPFPQDAQLVRDIVLHLHESGGVALPSGGVLSPRGLQVLGLSGLGSQGGFERLHFLFERAWEAQLVPGASRQLSEAFLHGYDAWLGFATSLLYAILHEAIYCQGAASAWAAQRVRDELDAAFDPVRAAEAGEDVPFTGEVPFSAAQAVLQMIFPWMFDEMAGLQPLKATAHLLAAKADWSDLYDKAALNANSVPVAAVAYYEDMYVSLPLSEATAGEIAGLRLWVTSEYMHSGIREDGPRVLARLLALASDRVPLR